MPTEGFPTDEVGEEAVLLEDDEESKISRVPTATVSEDHLDVNLEHEPPGTKATDSMYEARTNNTEDFAPNSYEEQDEEHGERGEEKDGEEEGERDPPEENAQLEEGKEKKTGTEDGEDERDFDVNPTVLFALLQKKDWKPAIERSQLHPEEAKVWVSRKEKDGRLRWRLLPIHAAIVFRAPEDVIETLLAAWPKGAQSKDDQGMLPLHLAFRNGSSEGVVNLLLVAFPQSIDVKDRKGRIPLVLAQASNSPNKEAFMRALERGPTYYAVAAAATERAAVTAEQKAIFDARVMQIKQAHQHEIAELHLEAENTRRELEAKLEEMEQELIRTQETSQVLVDHVNSLEAQLNSRSDTERFLATKIATLDSSLKDSNKTKEEIECKLRAENYELMVERDGYKAKFVELESKYHTAQEQLTKSLDLFEKREQEWARTERDLTNQVKSIQIDWANAHANCAILDAQLKKKMETEHALATQVSALAGKLAEAAGESRDTQTKFTKRIKDLEDERSVLRESVQDLTNRLTLVANVLEEMREEQHRILDRAKNHEQSIADALTAHSKIVAESLDQEHLIEQARKEREEMRAMLARQEEQSAANVAKRVSIMNAIAAQGQHMEKTKVARDDMLKSVENMGLDVKDILDNILSVIPKNGEQGEELVDAVINNVMGPDNKDNGEVKTMIGTKRPQIEAKPVSPSDDLSTTVGINSEGEDEEHPVQHELLSPENENSADRIMAARSDDIGA